MDDNDLSSGLMNLFGDGTGSLDHSFRSMGSDTEQNNTGDPMEMGGSGENTLTSQEQRRLEETARQLQQPRPSSARSSSKRWHNPENDKLHRDDMVNKVALLLRRRKESPPTEKWLAQLPKKAKRLEGELYRSASSLEEYTDSRTLKQRLLVVAQSIMNDFKKRSSHTPSSSHRSSTVANSSGSFRSTRDSLQSLNEGMSGASLGSGSFRLSGGNDSLGSASSVNPLPMDPPPSKQARRVSSQSNSNNKIAIENDKINNAKLQEQLLEALRRNDAELELLKSTAALETSKQASAVQPMQQRLSAVQQQPQPQNNWPAPNNANLLAGMAPTNADMRGLQTNAAVANLLQQQQQQQHLQQQQQQAIQGSTGGAFSSLLLGGAAQIPENLRMQAAMLNMQAAANPNLQDLARGLQGSSAGGGLSLAQQRQLLQHDLLRQRQQQQQQQQREQQIQMLLNNNNNNICGSATSTGSMNGNNNNNSGAPGDAPLSPGTFDW